MVSPEGIVSMAVPEGVPIVKYPRICKVSPTLLDQYMGAATVPKPVGVIERVDTQLVITDPGLYVLALTKILSNFSV
jgi:hypothetical protein